MSLDDLINVQITRESAFVSLPGFGVPLIVPASTEIPAAWVSSGERLRYYTDPAQMLEDGFTSSDEAYLEAQVLMSQNPRPSRFAVGRRLTPVAQVTTITVDTVVDTTNYTIDEIFDGDEAYGPFTYMSDGDALDTEIRDGLIALINATGILVTAAPGASNTITLTADTAGIPISVVESDANLSVGVTTPNVGLPEDLAAIVAEQPDWYGLLITQHDDQHILTAAAVAETMSRQFFAQSADAAIVALPYDDGDTDTDIASKVKARSYARTSVHYHPTATQRLASGLVGQNLPPVAGSRTWKFKTLAGVTTVALTPTQRTNLLSKSANSYESIGGRGSTLEGWVGAGEYIDVIHGLDRLHSRIQEFSIGALLNAPKVPFTQGGIETVAGGPRQALKEAASPVVNLIAPDRVRDGVTETPAWTVTPPALEDIPLVDRAQRRIPESNPIEFEGTLAGAIHLINVRGSVSV